MICEKVGFIVATSLARLFVILRTTVLDRTAIYISHPCIGQVQHRIHHCMPIPRSKLGAMLLPNQPAKVGYITIRLLYDKESATVVAPSTDAIGNHLNKSSSNE